MDRSGRLQDAGVSIWLDMLSRDEHGDVGRARDVDTAEADAVQRV